jgi:hypothetical protein
MIGRTCGPSSSAALRHSSLSTGMSRPRRNVSHTAFAAVAICRFHEFCASGVPGGSGGGAITDAGAGSDFTSTRDGRD